MPVPVDYTQPDGEQVGIAVILSPALGDNPNHRALVVNFGGPGDAGTDTLRYFVDELPDEIRNAFDIVSFDPRGVGSSRPIRCISAADADKLYAADPTADTAAELSAFYDGTAWPVDLEQGCIDRNGSWLAAVGTRNVARDLDRIRAALGNETLDFLGFSYGTVIAAVYAQMYPDRVGHFVLDSPVNLSVTSDQELVDDANGFEHALDSFLADCAARPKCSFHSKGDPTSALQQLQQQFEQGLTLRGDTLSGDKRRVACRRLLHRPDLRALRQAVRLARARRRVARRHRAQGRLRCSRPSPTATTAAGPTAPTTTSAKSSA